MRIWIENPFDNLPVEGFRPQRYWLMAQAFARAGHEVVLWTANFNHTTKQKRRFVVQPKLETDELGGKLPEFIVDGIRLILLYEPPYDKNVSLGRVISHRAYAKQWEAYARKRADALGHPDVIIVSTPPLATGDVAIRLARHWGAKLVVDVMDDWPGTFYRLLPRGLRWFGRMAFASAHRAARRLYAAADLVTGVADRYADLVSPKTFTRFYHGIEIDQFTQSAPIEQSNSQTTKQPNNLSLVYAGNLGRTYDLQTVVQVVDMLPNVTLDVAGKGEGLAALQARASDRIRIHGYLGADELKALLLTCDAGIVPMAAESCVGVPYKFGDYSAAGLAIMSSLGGESGDLLRRYGAGVSYQTGDAASFAAAIAELLPRIEEAKAGSRKMAEAEFDSRRIYDDYVRQVAL